MTDLFNRLFAIFTSIITMLSAVFLPSENIEPVFPENTSHIKTEFDEGDFIMGKNDLVVSIFGDDNNPGTIEAPLKSFVKAKEILKEKNSEETENITVWFREGTYHIDEKKTEESFEGKLNIQNMILKNC